MNMTEGLVRRSRVEGTRTPMLRHSLRGIVDLV